MKRYISYPAICLATIYLMLFAGCQKPEDSSGAPGVPPSFSLDMGLLSSFTSLKRSDKISDDSSNFYLAYQFVHPWDSMAMNSVSVPELLLKEATNHKQAVYDQIAGEWSRSYTVTMVGNGSYLTVLTGKIVEDSVAWNMKVSRIDGDGFYNFIWYEGKTDAKNTGGWWIVYDPVKKEAYLQVLWKQESESVKWVRYTNVCNDDASKGHSIKFGNSGTSDYNTYFDITDPATVVKVEWNQSEFNGRVTVNSASSKLWGKDGKNK
jgi:hypothetical protein